MESKAINLLPILTRFSIFSNIAVYIGGVEQWEYLLTHLNSKTRKSWMDNKAQYNRLEYINFGDANDLIDLMDEYSISGFGTYEFLNITFNFKKNNLAKITSFLQTAKYFKSCIISNVYFHKLHKATDEDLENLRQMGLNNNLSELNN